MAAFCSRSVGFGDFVGSIHVAAASGLCAVLAAASRILRIAVSRSARRIESLCSKKRDDDGVPSHQRYTVGTERLATETL